MARTTNRRVRNLAKATLVDADKLYQEIWAKTWEIPSAFVQCASSSTLCVSASFAEQISFLGAKGRSLNALLEKLVVELRKLDGQRKAAKKIRTQAKQLDTDYQAAVASLPTFQTVCNES